MSDLNQPNREPPQEERNPKPPSEEENLELKQAEAFEMKSRKMVSKSSFTEKGEMKKEEVTLFDSLMNNLDDSPH